MHNATSVGKIDSIFKDEDKDSSALLIGRLMSAGLNPNTIERIARIPDIGDLAAHYQSFHRGKISSDYVPRCAALCFDYIKRMVHGATKICLALDESPAKLLSKPCFFVVLISADIAKPLMLDASTPDIYDGEFVEDSIKDVLHDYGITPDQLVGVSTDNAKYMIKGVRCLREENKFKHVLHARCLFHGGDLMIQAVICTLESVNKVLRFLRQLACLCPQHIRLELAEKGVHIHQFRYAQTRWNSSVRLGETLGQAKLFCTESVAFSLQIRYAL